MQLPAQLWSNPQWAAMHSHDSATSSTTTTQNLSPPMDQSFYLSATSSPFSSAPQSPAMRDYLSMSPLTTPSLSRNTTPDPAHTAPTSAKGGKMCSHCKATTTPLWRRDPRTQKQLCNACGLYLQQRNKLRPQQLIDADADEPLETPYDPNAPECSHCHTRNTSVWRRSKDGAQLCNACGVYRRLRGKDRPLSLRRNRIKPRTKHNTV
jgi:GATA-binding protein 2